MITWSGVAPVRPDTRLVRLMQCTLAVTGKTYTLTGPAEMNHTEIAGAIIMLGRSAKV
jgi:hypothetical protein